MNDNAEALAPELLLLLLLGLVAVLGSWVGSLAFLLKKLRMSDPTGDVFRIPLPAPEQEIAFLRYKPDTIRYAEPVILCHGLGANRFNLDFFDDGDGSDRRSLARYLSRRGFDVWLLELRGTGLARVPRRADWSLDDEVNEDLPTAIEAVLAESGAARVLWVGHSKGGIMQYLFQGRKIPGHDKVAAMVAIGSPGTALHHGRSVLALVYLGRVLTMFLSRIPMRMLALPLLPLTHLIHFVGRRILRVIDALDPRVLGRLFANLPADISRGVADQLMDWAADPKQPLHGLEDHALKEVRLPMLLVAGSLDLLAPPAAMEHIQERVGSEDVTLRVMGRSHGSRVEYGHGDLIIGDHAPDEVFPLVGDWLAAHAKPV
jgi:predicted alpha/beta hydrolase